MADNDVTVKGWVLRETPSGMGVVFMANERWSPGAEVVLPRSLIAVVKGVMEDEVTMPRWLAEREGLG
jgi:hypothetical protein